MPSGFHTTWVVCGFTARGGKDGEVGSLLLGYYVGNQLHDAGSVGTGWNARTGRDLWARLTPLELNAAPFDVAVSKPSRWSRRAAGSERWVRPELVAEVEFAEWTSEGVVRQASFKGLRVDKPARGVVREAGETLTPAPASQVKVTHPERVVDPASGVTKLELVRYYESVVGWMLPHLKERPLAMVRAPTGISGATVLQIDKPDRVIFDLDPGEGVKWKQIQEAAVLVHALLTELDLKAWMKTSGGKGLHVVVPLTPRLDYKSVKAFSQAFVRHLAKSIPDRFSATSGAANRIGKIYVDYLRNGKAQTTATAFSARARPGMGVSMPVSWEQLSDLKSGAHWTVQTAREYLSFQTKDPWAEYWTTRQSLASAVKRLR